MLISMPEESSKKVFSGIKLPTSAVQNYFTSPTSSEKKIINAILLVPIIVPTAITLLSAGFTWLFLYAVNPQENDSTLSKIAKSVAMILIGVIAAAVLIPCIILNLVISLLPSLIFLAINRSIFSIVSTNQPSVNTENSQNLTGQVPNVNQVDIDNKEGYDKRIREGMDNLITDQKQNSTTDQEQSSEERHDSTNNHALVSNGQLYNQPDVEIISREGDQARDKTVVVKRINGAGVRDGKAMVRTTLDLEIISKEQCKHY
ncbi:MAG: hypothetical protein PG981_000128 [Wolbachia endosymbiont of Ctenocephalides orientis wCori]|nr:MAG: hypothetical protein PG981_000128 [Wolbachia endosymbiont of Ctenocephalides orientis wCori]